MRNRIKAPIGYKGVRIIQEGSKYYCTSTELGKVQITPNNALSIFMNCTSFSGDIQNELFLIGTNSKYSILYPQHSEEYQYYINSTIEKHQTHKEQYQNLKKGDCIFYSGTKQPLMYLGDIHILEFKHTKYFMDKHIIDSKNDTSSKQTLKGLSSSKYKVFCNEMGAVYVLNHKYPKHDALQKEFNFQHLGFDTSFLIGSEPEDIITNLLEDLEFKNIHCISSNSKLDIAFWDFKKFKAQDIESTSLQSNYTIQELLMNKSIHHTRHIINDKSIIDAVYASSEIWFAPDKDQGIDCSDKTGSVRPRYISFYKS